MFTVCGCGGIQTYALLDALTKSYAIFPIWPISGPTNIEQAMSNANPLKGESHERTTYRGVELKGKLPQSSDCRYFRFVEVDGKEAEFKDINFSYAIFERAYFRKAKFTNCNFTGAHFAECNFRNADFYGCTFDFATFDKTLIKPKQIIPCAPHMSAVKGYLMQALRANAVSISDYSAVRAYTLEEIEAKRTHCLKAWQNKEDYYKRKYPHFMERLAFLVKYWCYGLDNFVWGHGEKPMKAIMFPVIMVGVSALIKTSLDYHAGLLCGSPSLVRLFLDNFSHYGLSVVGATPQAVIGNVYYGLDFLIAIVRLIVIGLVVSLFFRLLSHR